ncbi:helix-turn-helix and ligand-binding sensor domain-containing protein [Flavobacterium pallidum]|uniref:Histidine kinase n=1 Tax=Flavobacterium pallidum TaxID=2172098 RepID=A0A2S1SLS7_9FLAO|nr:histidine kinase [Flavobacterium pallidum]AWI27316.1 histidine kinase [Flavobacterium pallidum]
MKRILIIAFSFVFAAAHAQELLPFVENFTKTEYGGDNQNWNVAQGNDNAIYFANNHYFLRYNGVKWEKYTLPNKTVIRSVFIDGDKIYTGSYKEFGYWKRIQGKMKYFSLTGKDLFSGSDNEEIWKIFKLNGRIYFQSFNEIFIYDQAGIRKIRFPFQISYCYIVDNQIYVASVRQGIYVMDGTHFTKKAHWSQVDNNVIHHIEKSNGRIYVFTKTNGVYVTENERLVPWDNPLNDKLKQQVIVTAKFVNDSTLAVGTGLQGLYIVDLKDNSYKNFNRENTLRNNAVLSILVDKENDIWLGLDNGIAHVEINSAINVFSDNLGILGSVYGISTIDDGYLFVTNHSVFIYRDKKLQSIPNSQGQVWDIYKIDNRYIIGHNDGTFIFDGKNLKKVNNVNGGWSFYKSDYDHVYFQPNYAGIAYYTDANDFSKSKFLSKLTKPIRNVAQNKPNELWAADNYRSLYRIRYDDNFNTIEIGNISQQNGLTNDFGVKIFTYKNEILFLINKVWYTFNAISEKLVRDNIFNKSFRNISDIIPIDDENFIVVNAGLLYVISQVNNEFVWELIPEKYYEGKLIFESSKAYKTGNKILLNLDDGFISYELGQSEHRADVVRIEAFYQGNLINDNTDIKYNQSVEINVIPGNYGYNRQDLFYKLNGSGDFQRVIKGNLVLNNLHSGNQLVTFYFFNGKDYIKVKDFRFDVDNPWYFSWWMILIYILIISGSFFLYYRWNKFRYMQKLQLKEEELKHEQKILELELKAENELNVQEYEKHILELEIQTKSSEVAGKSLSIAKQSEMIENIQHLLESEDDISKLKNEIRKVVKINSVNKHEWETFETNLNQIHNEFIINLTKKFPSLTSKDIRLCIYLKMNLSSKEIAPMMNISFRGVELHRYRLRKKLNLNQEENLNKFMLAI